MYCIRYYTHYPNHIKPQSVDQQNIGRVGKIRNNFCKDKILSFDFICLLCKHGAKDFEKVGG